MLTKQTLDKQGKSKQKKSRLTNGASNHKNLLYGKKDQNTRGSKLIDNPTLIRVMPEAMQNGTELEKVSKKVFLDRYSLKDEAGNSIEDYPEQMWRRVSRAIAQVEKTNKGKAYWEEKFYKAMEGFKFVPGGRILAGAGTGYAVTYYNCYCLPSPKDSREGILENLMEMVEIMSRGGGAGINLSSLRPRGARVKKVNGFSSGPMNWAELHSTATRDIIQQGGCFAGDTKIMTHLGLVPIKKIVKSKSNYYASTHKGYRKITTKFDNGTKAIFEVKTESGFKVKTTLDHKFLTFNEKGNFYQKKLKELKEGDNVVQLLGNWHEDIPNAVLSTNLQTPSKHSYGLKDIKLPKFLDEDLAFVLGAYDADGTRIPDKYSPNGKGIKIAAADDRPADLQKLITAIKRCFNVNPILRKGDSAVTIIQVFSRRLNEFLAVNGLLKQSSTTVSVPKHIFTSPRKVVEAYLGGVFLGDGSNRGGKGGLRITTISKKFAQELQLLLLNLQIASKIKVQTRREKHWQTLISRAKQEKRRKHVYKDVEASYTVTVNGAIFMKRFASLLAPYTEKVFDKPISVRDGAFGWPFNLVERFNYIPHFQKTMARSNPTTSQKSVMFLQQVTPALQETDKPDINYLVNCIPDKISSIKPVGDKKAYDLEVEDAHLLSGNGFYTSNSRRGALMLMLWDWHPDIEEFITIKKDLTKIRGANLSVCVSDRLMQAIKNDEDWPLLFPDLDDPEYDEVWDGILENWVEHGKKVKVYKTIRARKLWDMICEAAWASAEPGLHFMERTNKWSNNYYFNKLNCTNPCVTGDTLVITNRGWQKAKYLKPGIKILTPKGFRPIEKFYNNGVKRIFKIRFSDRGSLKATSDHKLRVVREDGKQEWVETNNLKKGDKILKLLSLRPAKQGRQGNENKQNKYQESDYHHKILSIQAGNIHNYNFAFLAKTKLTTQEESTTIIQNNTPSQSTLSTPVNKGVNMATAKTTCPTSAAMSDNFFSSESVSLSLSSVGHCIDQIIQADGKKWVASYGIVTVMSVKDTGREEEVFDVYEPETLTWITNGYVSLDCGEEPLPNYGVCNLGSLNLANFVDEQGKMDYQSLAEHAKVAVRFQDNVIDGDIYVLPGIIETQLNGERRIGIGTMGLGDALIKMKVRYGSDESLPIIEKIYKTIRNAAFEASADIAAEKGSFPKFDKKKYLMGYFSKKLPQNLRQKIARQGIRNSVLLMQAPTGSTSLMCNVTSGIEPVYEFVFTRRDRIGEHKIYHPLYKAWRKAHPGEKRPNYFVSANDLTPEDHVRVQAAIQKYVDASISKTVNAPKAHSVLDVKKLYTLAYELGCKGITYMRDGSREGVLVREEPASPAGREKPQKKQADVKTITTEQDQQRALSVSNDAPSDVLSPRPEVAFGATYKVATPMGSAFITINEDERGGPMEVFINIGKAGSDLTAMAAALGRMISTILRLNSGVDPQARAHQVIEQLAGIGGRRSVGFGPNKVHSLPDAVARALLNHFNSQIPRTPQKKSNPSNSRHSRQQDSSYSPNYKQSLFRQNKQSLFRRNKTNGESINLQAGAVMAAHNFDPTPAPADVQSSRSSTNQAPPSGVPADAGNHRDATTQTLSPEPEAPNVSFDTAPVAKKDPTNTTKEMSTVGADICPNCGATALVHEEGCAKCYACGHAEC